MENYMTVITTIEEFEKAFASERVSVFTFSAEWCPDCQFIKPFMPKLVEAYKDYDFYYIDRDKAMEVCQRAMVMGIPSFVASKNGEELNRFVSKFRKTEKEIDEFLSGLQK